MKLYADYELLQLIRQHDMCAFEEVYNRYWNLLFDAAYNRLKQKESCEEMIQEIFVTLWEKRENLEITSGLRQYLFTAVKYKVIDFYRKQLTRMRYIPVASAGNNIDNSAEEHVFLNDLKTHIEKVVRQLPDKCRSVYELSRMENKSNKEIATLLNISEKTVEGHLTRALHTLRAVVGYFIIMVLTIFC